MGPIVSMEMPLAKAYLKVSHIIEWVKSINSFENQPLVVMLIWPRFDFKLKKKLLIYLIETLLRGLLGRSFEPGLDPGQPE